MPESRYCSKGGGGVIVPQEQLINAGHEDGAASKDAGKDAGPGHLASS